MVLELWLSAMQALTRVTSLQWHDPMGILVSLGCIVTVPNLLRISEVPLQSCCVPTLFCTLQNSICWLLGLAACNSVGTLSSSLHPMEFFGIEKDISISFPMFLPDIASLVWCPGAEKVFESTFVIAQGLATEQPCCALDFRLIAAAVQWLKNRTVAMQIQPTIILGIRLLELDPSWIDRLITGVFCCLLLFLLALRNVSRHTASKASFYSFENHQTDPSCEYSYQLTQHQANHT